MADLVTFGTLMKGGATSVEARLSKIIGRPHTYLQNSDPKKRTFIRHMLPSAPLVAIRPGHVKFSTDVESTIKSAKAALGITDVDSAKSAALGNSDRGTMFDPALRYGVTSQDTAAINQAILDKQSGSVRNMVDANSGTLRYFEFESQIPEFFSVYATTSSRMYSRLRNAGTLWENFTTVAEAADSGGFLTFWADNATSVSESASAEVGPTALAGLVKGVSDLSRQAQFFLGTDAQKGERGTMLDKTMGDISNLIGGGDTAGLRASLGGAILGMNPMFPDVWKDSSFSRSYNLTFKFHSPYGHPGAIYQNVLAPFALLLSLVLPISRGPAMYSTPFVFQMDCPGYFACELGVCTGFDFVKGGSENLWTDEGLPREITVTMQVRDLYPVLTSSPNNQSLYFNVGMGTFLDNLVAINLAQQDSGKGDVIQRLRANVFGALQQGAGRVSSVGEAIKRFNESTGIAGLSRSVAGKFGGFD